MRFRVKRALSRGADAVVALGARAAGPLADLLAEREWAKPAARALRALGAMSRDAVEKRLRKPRSRAHLHRLLTVAGQLRPRRDPGSLLPFMEDPSARTRGIALLAIARQGGSRAHSALAAALGDADPVVRMRALDLLAVSPEPRAIRHLIAAVAAADPDLARAAAAHIRDLGYLATGPLVESLRTTDESLRETCASLLLERTDERSLVILSKGLEEDDPRLWRVVSEVLVDMGPGMARQTVEALMAHPEPDIRQRALGILDLWNRS
jgi:HEAT repeat protein